MKFIITLLLITFVYAGSAQAPALINYQGVARDSKGTPIVNQNIALKFEVLQGSATGAVIYTDDQPNGVKTNELGLFTTQIGKNAPLGQMNWQGGPYYLRVWIDPAGGSNLISLGTQQIISVPFAVHAQSIPSNLSGGVLTIGTRTHAINANSVTISQGTGTNITVSGGPNYTIHSVPPTLALTSNNASISIVGSNTIALPVAATPTLVGAGIATVVSGASTYTVGVPAPSYNPLSGVLSIGSSNTPVTPTLVLNNGVLYSGPPTNSVTLPTGVTVSGTGLASVTGFPNYVVNVPPPALALSPNNLSISIVGSNSVALPAAVTVSAPAGGIVSVTGGPTNYGVSIPNPVWTGTALTLGATTTTIAPTLILGSGGILTSGPPTNSVNIGNIGPWRQAVGSVTLGTVTDNVAINTPGSPAAKLEVWGSATTTSPTIKAINQNAANTSAALDVSSNGALGLQVNNTSPNGIGGAFSSTVGYALSATNTSSLNSTIFSQNFDATTPNSYAGYFNGGFVAQSKPLPLAFALNARSSSNADLFVVRNDGKVGLGTGAPQENFQVESATNTQLSLISGGSSNILFGSSGIHNQAGIMYSTSNNTMSIWTNSTPDRIYIESGGNVGIGIGAGAIVSKLDVNGNMRVGNGSTAKLFFGTTNGINDGYTGIHRLNDDLVLSVFKAAGGSAFGTNSYDAVTVKSNSGNVGIGVANPSQKLEVNGSIKMTDGLEAQGKILVSDGAGVASWKSSPAAIQFGGLNVNTVTANPAGTTLSTSAMSFNKQYASTEVEITLYSMAYSGSFNAPATTIYFEIYVDGAPGSAATRHYFFSSAQAAYMNLKSYFTGLSSGSHTITIIAKTDAGTSTGVLLDPGGYNGRVLVKEIF